LNSFFINGGIMLQALLDALVMAASFENLFAIIIGIATGVILGSIPGLSGTMAIALIVPLTFLWSPLFSIALLMGLWKGSVYGGSISAILLNTPGTPEAAATALDGYPLTQQGKSGKALKMALVASVIGAIISDVLLFGAAPPLSKLALQFGPPALAMLIVFALILVAGTGSRSHVKGLISTALGILLATVGLDPMTAQRRFTFDVLELDSGIGLLAMLIGLLVMSEILAQVWEGWDAPAKNSERSIQRDHSRLTWPELRPCLGVIFRSSLIGSLCGALPGVGSITAAFMGYDHARVTTRDSSQFGKGELKGVAAPEAANNAVCGAALIPMVTLGIPGSLSVAVIMGAFIVHGLTPGPMLMAENPEIIYALFILLLISDIVLLLVSLPLLVIVQAVVRVPRRYLLPIILILCGIGAYSTEQSIFDVKIMVIFGVVGFFMKRWGFSPAALLVAFILGPMAEVYLRQSMRISGGDPAIFLTTPLSLFFAVAAAGLLLWSLFSRSRRKEGKITKRFHENS
jgi:putative tricarboxylic transport membrane protein